MAVRGGRHRQALGLDCLVDVGDVPAALEPDLQDDAEVGERAWPELAAGRGGGDGLTPDLHRLIQVIGVPAALEPFLQRTSEAGQDRMRDVTQRLDS
jgi:hypothetical protein